MLSIESSHILKCFNKKTIWAAIKDLFKDSIQNQDPDLQYKSHKINCSRGRFVWVKFTSKQKNCNRICEAFAENRPEKEASQIFFNWSGKHHHEDDDKKRYDFEGNSCQYV